MLYVLLFQLLTTVLLPQPTLPELADNDMVFISQDEGASWETFGKGLPADAVARDVIHHNGRLLLITDRYGVFRRTSKTASWEATNLGLPNKIYLNSIAAVENTIAIGSFEQGVFISRNGGESWQRPFSNLKGGSVRALFFHEGTLIAGTDSGIYLSSHAATFWQHFGDLRQVNDLRCFQGDLFAARMDGVVRSKDGGKTWEKLLDKYTVSELSIAEGKLYAHFLGGKDLRRSGDGGESWEQPIRLLPNLKGGSLTKALWSGYQPLLEDGTRLYHVKETPLGWIGSKPGGC